MPLPVAHGLLGGSIVAALHPQPMRGRYAIPLFTGAFLANAADFDFLLVFAFHSPTWHRGFSHSIILAVSVCVLAALFAKQRLKETLAYGLAFASHGILDYVTTKRGVGVELLWPISKERLILGWWGLSEVPSKLTRMDILEALVVELALFTPILLAVMFWRRMFAK
jgi:membrane-bound metal-dependent hydrolase YbcI (DUF457 family)